MPSPRRGSQIPDSSFVPLQAKVDNRCAQGRIAANAGYKISCVRYLVSGYYTVWLRTQSGSYSYASNQVADTPTVIMSGCGAPLTDTFEIEVFTTCSKDSLYPKYILGYDATFVAGLSPMKSAAPIVPAINDRREMTPPSKLYALSKMEANSATTVALRLSCISCVLMDPRSSTSLASSSLLRS
jgi:hypothetical protein